MLDRRWYFRFETGSISKLRSSVSKLTDFFAFPSANFPGSSIMSTDLLVVEHQIAAIFIIFLKTGWISYSLAHLSTPSPGFVFDREFSIGTKDLCKLQVGWTLIWFNQRRRSERCGGIWYHASMLDLHHKLQLFLEKVTGDRNGCYRGGLFFVDFKKN